MQFNPKPFDPRSWGLALSRTARQHPVLIKEATSALNKYQQFCLIKNIQTLPVHAQQHIKALSETLDDLRATVGRAANTGRDGALISLACVSVIYPLATISSLQRLQGNSFGAAVRELHQQGGLPRFYKGLAPSVVGVMLGRFCAAAGDLTATEVLEKKYPQFKNPASCALLGGMIAVALYCPLIPLETLAATARSSGGEGVRKLGQLVLKEGAKPLYNGLQDTLVESLVDHVVWYGAKHVLDTALPEAQGAQHEFLRSCLIGALAGVASDICSYPISVIKIQKQVLQSSKSSFEIGHTIVQEKGVGELWRRGFSTTVASHCVSDSGFQAAMNMREKSNSASV